MVQLTLDDVMRWTPGRFWAPASQGNLREALAVELSWAVTIRATAPVLPSIRGGELVIVPAEILAELRERESIGWRQVFDQLMVLPVAAVLTDDPSIDALAYGLILLQTSGTIPEDMESSLNREIIERRGELYQLGSELAREFSAASIRGSSLETLLEIAGSTGGIPVALVAGSGAVLAGARDGLLSAGLPFDPERLHIPLLYDGLEWVCHPVSSLALPEGVVLVGGIQPEEPGDRARLTLEQTAESLGMLFDRLPPVETLSPQREIEQLLEQILIHGNVTPVARRRFTHLASDLGIRGDLRLVARDDRPDGPSGPTRELRLQHGSFNIRVVGEEQYAEILREDGPAVVSVPVPGIDGLATLLPAVLRVATLMRSNLIGAETIDLGEPACGSGVVALLMAGMASERVADIFRGFAAGRLEALDFYDRERRAELVKTLAAYLEKGATIAAAARALGIHRNTLAYRIARIEEIGRLSLADPATRFDLELAITLRRLLDPQRI